ncbi:bifunctional riboflavin kinase/FAD synthetase [uncultured Cocleimonas sp.]|uniref:bifunctional riboflavin kinase/FAD synthetase n=1 Tax=uncultured Cocleimonas sp. TaxID=1051587 RepID=UPI002635D3F8|nr:bifunctional riboflavin kinase/FAD synthetase [uncultured Cocleimonas sp.]
MNFIRHIDTQKKNNSACVATIGNFDGLHLGHQKIISKLKQKAQELQLPLTVLSFEPLPAEYFSPNPPTRIYPLRDKIRLLEQLGVNNFLCLKFDKAFANMPPEVFVKDILQDYLNVKHLAVGDDFKFGYNRGGDFAMLNDLGKHSGMTVVDTPTVEKEAQRVSSTRIRKALEQGDISLANSLLGYNYQLSGRVRHGEKRGRTINFPTLNLKLPENISPKRGVYAVRVHGLNDSIHTGVANLGNRPTVSGSRNRLEVHLFDFSDSVYGKYVCVELLEFIREEKRFENLDKLKEQILIDAEKAKTLIAKMT